MSDNAKWNDLPDVVALLQSEAAGAAPRPRRSAPVAPPVAAEARGEDAWAERLNTAEDHTLVRRRALPAAALAPRRVPDAAEMHDDDERETTAPGWPGLADYETLLADATPDPRALLTRLRNEAEAAFGARAGTLRPLFDQVGRALDRALQQPLTPQAHAEAQAALTRMLDKLEDLLSILMVRR
jgi:hypothetical protein